MMQRAQDGQVRLLGGTLSSAMIMYATKAKTSVPPARPSRPSVMFTPLAVATIAKAAKAMYSVGSIGPRRRTARRSP